MCVLFILNTVCLLTACTLHQLLLNFKFERDLPTLVIATGHDLSSHVSHYYKGPTLHSKGQTSPGGCPMQSLSKYYTNVNVAS